VVEARGIDKTLLRSDDAEANWTDPGVKAFSREQVANKIFLAYDEPNSKIEFFFREIISGGQTSPDAFWSLQPKLGRPWCNSMVEIHIVGANQPGNRGGHQENHIHI
jgi:hypothetical protein